MKELFYKLGAGLSVLPTLVLPSAAKAVTYTGLSDATTNLGEIGTKVGGEQDLTDIVGNLINVLLSVLGIIFVVLVVYAGYLYLTSAGEDEKVKKAKKLLGQAVIGLVIVIAAYAISSFVISALVEAGSV